MLRPWDASDVAVGPIKITSVGLYAGDELIWAWE